MSYQNDIIDSVKNINIIEIVYRKGTGTEGDPYRLIKQYWSTDGILLAVSDPSQ